MKKTTSKSIENQKEIIAKANSLKHSAKWYRFNYCNAYTSDEIFRYENENLEKFILIKSYNTIVGLADLKERTVYEFGKYSSTTSKQFTQICNSEFKGFTRELFEITNW